MCGAPSAGLPGGEVRGARRLLRQPGDGGPEDPAPRGSRRAASSPARSAGRGRSGSGRSTAGSRPGGKISQNVTGVGGPSTSRDERVVDAEAGAAPGGRSGRTGPARPRDDRRAAPVPGRGHRDVGRAAAEELPEASRRPPGPRRGRAGRCPPRTGPWPPGRVDSPSLTPPPRAPRRAGARHSDGMRQPAGWTEWSWLVDPLGSGSGPRQIARLRDALASSAPQSAPRARWPAIMAQPALPIQPASRLCPDILA